MQKRELFNWLVTIADYSVKIGAANYDSSQQNLQPNLINESKLSSLAQNIQNNLQQSGAKIKNLYIGLDNPSPSAQMCIYRLVVVEDATGREIKKLYVCGDYADT